MACPKMLTAMLLVLAMTMIERRVQATPLGQCSVNQDCGQSACCLVGYDRYSFPQCSPRGSIGDWCRFMSSPKPMTLAYPNGLMINLKEAYHGMCPCLPGLICSRHTSTCQLPEVTSEEENSLNGLVW